MTTHSSSEKKRVTVDELTRLAFLWAEQDRLSFAECQHAGSPERIEAEEMVRLLTAYRVKRWGKTTVETTLEGATLVEVKNLRFPR